LTRVEQQAERAKNDISATVDVYSLLQIRLQ